MMNNKTLTITVVLLAIALAFMASRVYQASSKQSGLSLRNADSVLDRVKKERIIRAGVVPYPPFAIKDPNTGKFSGYFVELMDEVAKFMGTESLPVRIDYEETSWGAMISGLHSGQFDVVVSGVFSTIPRGLEVTWAEPCMYVGMSALVRKSDSRFSTPADLEKPGLTIAVSAGEVGHEYVKKFLTSARPIVLQTSDTAATALEVSSGNADVALAESVALIQYAKEHSDVQVLFTEAPIFTYATSVMIRKGDQDWKDFLDQSIRFLQLAGVTDRLDRKYNPDRQLWLSPKKPWAEFR